MSQAYLVIGAAGGIGVELCRRLVATGSRVLLCGRDAASLKPLADELGQPTRAIDAREWGQTAEAVRHGVEQFGRLDGAVNLAGSLLLKPAHLTTEQEWQEVIAQNLTTAMGLVRAAAPAMRTTGGSIVLMSSAAATIGLACHEAIAAAKAGVEGLVRSAAATYAGSGVRVNAVAPGLIQTPLTQRVWSSPRGAETSLAMHPLGRLGQPSDIASAIFWLLSPEQTWVTGQVLGVDGGLGRLKATR